MRVSPFRHLRVNGYVLLTAAFRSLSRLSSVLGAKAFTLRSSLLDLLSLNHKDLSLILHFQQNCLFNKIVDFSIRLSLYLSSLSIFRFSYIFCSIIQFSRCSLTKVTVVGSNGLEPSTSRLSGARSNHLSYEPSTVVEIRRIELLTSCVQGRRSPS